MMERFRTKKQPAQDGLYVETFFTPNGSYKWQARLYDDEELGRYTLEYGYAVTEWGIKREARKMLARERKKRRLQQAARDYGKKVIR